MRIIGGSFKGRHLVPLTGMGVRPTPDRVREAMFSILETRPQGARILDLYAGTGALGLEALSRGGISAVFVDISPKSVTMIYKNIENLGAQACQVINAAAIAALPRLSKKGQAFDLIFMDPPYHQDLVLPTLQKLDKLKLVAEGGLVVIDHEPGLRPPQEVGGLLKTDYRRYGDVAFSMYAPLD